MKPAKKKSSLKKIFLSQTWQGHIFEKDVSLSCLKKYRGREKKRMSFRGKTGSKKKGFIAFFFIIEVRYKWPSHPGIFFLEFFYFIFYINSFFLNHKRWINSILSKTFPCLNYTDRKGFITGKSIGNSLTERKLEFATKPKVEMLKTLLKRKTM